MGKMNFCQRFVFLDNQPISFADRPYLPAIYAAGRRNLVLRCSRQCEKSTFLVNTILHAAVGRPGIKLLVVMPREEQVRTFSKTRLLRCLQESPLLRGELLGKGSRVRVRDLAFANGSQLFFRAAFHDADAARGLSADRLFIDEYQDLAPRALEVLQESLSHSADRRLILTGTPKSIENPLEAAFARSTRCAWTIRCAGCGSERILDERAMGPAGPVCGQCRAAIDPRQGRWVAQQPDASWGDGFWVNHLMTPWVDYGDLLERQQTYDPARFINECLGLPCSAGGQAVTLEELENCCDERPMARTLSDIPREQRRGLVAGIDWGGGGTSRTGLGTRERPAPAALDVAQLPTSLRSQCSTQESSHSGTAKSSVRNEGPCGDPVCRGIMGELPILQFPKKGFEAGGTPRQ